MDCWMCWKKRDVGCIPFSPLAQGLLTDRYLNGIPEGSRIAGESIFLTEESLDAEPMVKIKALNQHAEQRGQTLAQMALAWILSQETDYLGPDRSQLGITAGSQCGHHSTT